MSSFDLGQQTKVAYSFSAKVDKANANGNAIDTALFEGTAVAILLGDVTETINAGNGLSIAYREGDDTNVANATALAASRIIAAPEAATANAAVIHSLAPTKRYVFPEVYLTNSSKSNVNANVAITGVLGYPVSAPTS